jgi:hypothetical protein
MGFSANAGCTGADDDTGFRAAWLASHNEPMKARADHSDFFVGTVACIGALLTVLEIVLA